MRHVRGLVLVMLGSALLPGSSIAQQKSYPEKPITLLVPYGVNGASDQFTRAFAEAAKKYLNQPIVVVNRPGDSGSRAIAEALRATPDGYTLAFGTIATLTVQPQRIKLPYGGPETYVPIAKLMKEHNVLIVKAGAPWKTAQEFLKYAREHPGTLRVGVPEVGSVPHLDIEQLQRIAKVHFNVRSTFSPETMSFAAPQQVAAVLRGEVDAAVAGSGPVVSYVNEHKAMMLGVFDEHRLALAPDVPTFKEIGSDVTLGSIGAIVAPRDTPAYVVTKLNETIRKVLAEPSFVSFVEMGGITMDYEGPEALTRELRRAYEESGELVRSLGLAQK